VPKSIFHRLWAILYAQLKTESGAQRNVTRAAMKTPARLVASEKKIKTQ